MIFLLDMFLQMRTAYCDRETETYIFNTKKILARYFKNYFLTDLLSIIPFDLFVNIIYNKEIFDTNLNATELLHVRWVEIFLLLKWYRIYDIHQLTSKLKFNESILYALQLSGKLFYISHILACSWYYLSSNQLTPGQFITMIKPNSTSNRNQPYTVSLSFSNQKPTWISVFGYADSTLNQKYIAALYWTYATMITVGYGDIHAVNRQEQAFSIAVELLGVIIFGAIISQMVDVLKNVDPKRQAMRSAVTELMAYLGEGHIPLHIRQSARVCTTMSLFIY